MAVNLNDTTPAAGSGRTNVTWQKDSSGNISASIADTPGASGAGNEVLATPNGSSGVVALRALVAADIPALAVADITGLVAALALKAPLASPTFTGTALAPTPSTADNSTKIATTAYVQAQGYGAGSSAYTTSWTSQTSVTVTHSLGTKDVTVQVYDASDVQVIPESVTTTSTSVVTLTFGASFTGRVVVLASGAPVPSTVLYADDETPSGTVNGSNDTFTVANTPNPSTSLQFFINGVLQTQGTDYTLSTATITCTGAPDSGALLTAFYRY